MHKFDYTLKITLIHMSLWTYKMALLLRFCCILLNYCDIIWQIEIFNYYKTMRATFKVGIFKIEGEKSIEDIQNMKYKARFESCRHISEAPREWVYIWSNAVNKANWFLKGQSNSLQCQSMEVKLCAQCFFLIEPNDGTISQYKNKF